MNPTVFNIFGAKARITILRAESKRTPKDFLTCVNANLARVLIVSRNLLNGSLLPVESQLQSSFWLSNISRPLVVLQRPVGLIESFQSFIKRSSLCLANRGFAGLSRAYNLYIRYTRPGANKLCIFVK